MKGGDVMLNQSILVGRIVRDPEIKKSENEKSFANVTIAVPRSYKNADGEYDTDFIDCIVWGGVAENMAEYCKKGDLVGIKGRIETWEEETEQGKNKKATIVVADKITYLAQAKEKQSEEEMDM